MTEVSSSEKDKYTKQLKRRMECWREIILPLNSVLLWERSWHPGLLFGLSSLIFFLIWILVPTLLTVISISLLMAALIDYLVPIVSSTFFSANNWTGQKERKLDDICQNLSATVLRLESVWKTLLNARNNRPNLYYGSLTIFLLFIAWIGNTINNLLLIYIIDCEDQMHPEKKRSKFLLLKKIEKEKELQSFATDQVRKQVELYVKENVILVNACVHTWWKRSKKRFPVVAKAPSDTSLYKPYQCKAKYYFQ